MEKKKTGKAKYNWPELKLEFFQSESLEITDFFRRRFNVKVSKNIQVNTAGWTREKKDFQKKITKEALEALEDQEKKNYAIGLKNLMNSILGHVKTEEELRKLNLKDKQLLWDILMTMNDRPTQVSKSKQVHSVDPEQEDAVLDRLKSFLPSADSDNE